MSRNRLAGSVLNAVSQTQVVVCGPEYSREVTKPRRKQELEIRRRVTLQCVLSMPPCQCCFPRLLCCRCIPKLLGLSRCDNPAGVQRADRAAARRPLPSPTTSRCTPLLCFAPSRLRVRILQRSRYAPKLNVCSPPVRQEAKHKGTHRIEAIPPSRFDKPGTHSSPHSTRFVPTTHLHPSGIVPTASEEVDLTAERQAMSYRGRPVESAKEFPQRGKAGHRKAVIQTQKRIRRRILIDCRRQTNGRVNCDYLEPVPRTTIFQFPWRKTKNRERYVDSKRQRRGMFIAPRHDSLDRKPQRGGMMRQVPQKRRISMGSFHAAPTELALWDGGVSINVALLRS